MSREFEIIKKKNLPDEAQVIGFTFLKEPSREDKEKNKYDFIESSNENEIGCMLSKRESWAFSKGYVKVDNKVDSFVEVKTRWPIILIILLGIMVCLLLCLRSCDTEQVVNPPVSNNPVIEQPVGNFEVSDNQKEKEEVEKVPSEIPTITFAGYGKYSVSADRPSVELKNPDVNFVDMVFTLTDKASGELIARTGKVAAGEFVYVNVMDFYKESGVYDVQVSISTFDSETGTPMNGMNQEMEIVVS